MTTFGKYFCGNEISKYGQQNGRVDYATFAKAFDAVLNNNIMQHTGEGYWQQENGPDNSEEIEELQDTIGELYDKMNDLDSTDYEDYAAYEDKRDDLQDKIRILEDQVYDLEQEEEPEIYQYYIVSDGGADLIREYTDDPLFYNDELDMYVWGVTHFGTSWSYVLTSIPCEKQA